MTDEQLAFHGAGDVAHSTEDLLAHLQGTEALLVSFGAREQVCTAGLIHSVYGTESFQTAVLPLGLRFLRSEEFQRMRPHLLPGSWEAIADAYGFDR